MSDHQTRIVTERGHRLAQCECGWERLADSEATAREYARKRKPRLGKETS